MCSSLPGCERFIVKRIFVWIIALFVVLSLVTVIYDISSSSENVSLVKEACSFSEVLITDGQACLNCKIALQNNNSSEATVKLSAHSVIYDGDGIPVVLQLDAVNSDGSIRQFSVPAGSELTFDVLFAGECAMDDKLTENATPQIVVETVG